MGMEGVEGQMLDDTLNPGASNINLNSSNINLNWFRKQVVRRNSRTIVFK